MEYFLPVGPSLLFRSPILLAWIVGIVIAARMLKRGGGKAERLLLIGCSLMFAENLISPFSTVLITWLIAEQAVPVQRAAFIGGITGIPLGIISLAGIVCLVYAFWTRWRTKSAATQ